MAYGQNQPLGLDCEYNQGAGAPQIVNTYRINPSYATAIFKNDPVMFLNDGTIGKWAPGNSCCGVFQGVNFTTISTPQPQGNYIYSAYWYPNMFLTINPNSIQAPIAYVLEDPTQLYSIQASWPAEISTDVSTVPIGIASNDIGLNANMAWGTGIAFTNAAGGIIPPANPANGNPSPLFPGNPYQFTSGLSVGFLDLSTLTTSSTALLKIIRLVNIPVTTGNLGVMGITPLPGEVGYITAGNVPYTGNSGTPGFGVGPGAFNNAVVMINNDVFKGGTGTAGSGAAPTIQTIYFPLTESNIRVMQPITVQVIAAPGAGLKNVILNVTLTTTRAATVPFAAGGDVGFEYQNITGLLGTSASTTVTAAQFIAAANTVGANLTFSSVTVVSGPTVTNQIISISNTAAAFTSGTNWLGTLAITYMTVPA